MGWASAYIEKLKKGETVQFRPRGSSMKGRVESGQLCTVEPVDENTALVEGMIVLCKVHGNEYLHLIKSNGSVRYQIGNNRGGVNGWVGRNSIFGVCIKVED